MEEMDTIKASLVANKEKKISVKTLKRIIATEIISRNKVYIQGYDLRNILKSIDDSNLSEEQKEELAKHLVESAKKSVETIQTEVAKIFGNFSNEGDNNDVQ